MDSGPYFEPELTSDNIYTVIKIHTVSADLNEAKLVKEKNM